MTGGYLRPSFYNKPLPRLNPQPTSISVMIFRRRRARSRRVLDSRKWKNWIADLGLERQFEAYLAAHTRLTGQMFEPIYKDMRSWRKEIVTDIFAGTKSLSFSRQTHGTPNTRH